MQRGTVGIFILTLVAASVGAAPQVLGPDDRPLDRARLTADADAYWVRNGTSLPVLLTPDADDQLRFPRLAVARMLVLDANTGQPVTTGRLRWAAAEIPDSVSTVTWTAQGGRLDLGCRGGESVELTADDYRPLTIILDPGRSRRTVLLEAHGDLEIIVQPPSAGHLWIAARKEVTAISPFYSASTQHEIGADGSAVVLDLDASAAYDGVVVVPGRTPIVGHIQGLPRRLELETGPGFAITGRVLDRRGRPLARARVHAVGTLETLGGFRYRQQGRTDAGGRFTITGLLAGEIAVKACAAGHACAEFAVSIADGGAALEDIELVPGHDLRLVVQNPYGRPAAGATVIDTVAFRKHRTDDDGVLVFEGVEAGEVLDLEIFGAGLRPWQGRIETDRTEIVLQIPAGGVLEWPILTERDLAEEDVMATWTRFTSEGREVTDGFAHWDPHQRVIRADGLDTGPHRLEVRLPGSATLRSELVEVGLGAEVRLPAVIPNRGMAIAGRVLDGVTLDPVAGARVNCEPGSPNQFRKPQHLERLQTTITDADGLFLLEGLDSGPCRAVIRAPGFAPWRRDHVEPDEVGADLGDIELDDGMAIVGRVLDRSDRPQPGMTVEITEDAAYAYFAETTVRTDHDGWFRAETLPIGSWVLRTSRGEATARATVQGRRGETGSVELRLGGLRLEGEILIGDRPASGGHLVLATDGAHGDGVVVMVQSDADQRRFFGIDRPPVTLAIAHDGRFATEGISPGVYTASYTPPAVGGAPVSRELVIPQTELHRCVIQYSDAGLEGRVVDPEGMPVAGAGIFVRAQDGRTVARGFSDGDGAFLFIGLDGGTVRVEAIHGGFGDSQPMDLELRTGDRLGPVTLELQAPDGANLAVPVQSAAGSLSGASVYLVGAETLTGFTDGRGTASFTGVDPGWYRPCAAAYGGAAGCGPKIELRDGDERDVILDLGRGGSVNVLLGPMERPPALRVMTADGIDLTSILMMVSPPMPGLDGIVLGPLKADDYRITVAMSEGPRQGTVTVTEGETAVLDLR